MNKLKKLFAVLAALALILLALACVTFNGSVATSDVAYADSDSWLDKNFKFAQIDVEIEVGKDKVYTVKETLKTVFFRSDTNRGIIRDIQHETTTTRYINGKKVKGKSFFTKLDNVKASFEGSSIQTPIEVNSEMYSIYLRKPNGYIEGREEPYTFVLEYTYDMSDDKVSGYDDFVFDVLGYEMNKTELFNATIIFPDEISANKVSVRTNEEGRSWVYDWEPDEGESLKIEGNVIKIAAQPYAKDKGYTVQVILPNGYFSEASVTFYWYYVIFAIMAALGLAVAAALFLKYCGQGKTVEVIEYYPPEELTVMAFSSIWHRGARAKDSAALILKWANLGLLTIEQDGPKHLILRPTGLYKVEKEEIQLQADGTTTVQYTEADKKYFDNAAEKAFFARIFSGIGGDGVFSTRLFKDASQQSKILLAEDVETLVKSGGDDKNLHGKVGKVRMAIPFLGLIPTLAIVIYYSILTAQFFPLFFFIFMAAGTFVGTQWLKTPQVLVMIIFPVFFYGMIYGVFAGMFTLTAYDYAYLLWIAPIIWAACMFVLPFFVKDKRSGEAQRMYGRLKGFKNFLLKAELPRIQLLFDENPEYFSDILAPCMIMGISDKVQKRFATLSFTTPAYMQNGVNERWVRRCMHRCHFHSIHILHRSSSSNGGSHFGGGGGGHHGSHGGGGGGGRSRGC